MRKFSMWGILFLTLRDSCSRRGPPVTTVHHGLPFHSSRRFQRPPSPEAVNRLPTLTMRSKNPPPSPLPFFFLPFFFLQAILEYRGHALSSLHETGQALHPSPSVQEITPPCRPFSNLVFFFLRSRSPPPPPPIQLIVFTSPQYKVIFPPLSFESRF